MRTRNFFIILSLLSAMHLHVKAASRIVAEKSDTAKVENLKSVSVVAKSKASQLKEGAFSVNALSVRASANKLVSLNDIVDRSAGVKVRRTGGVGSDYDLSINGLSGNSIRFFIDGVPLDSKGSDVNLDNIPVNMVERIELYKGVVPSHLSSDALGGAVNIITKKIRRDYVDLSLGGGSFGTSSVEATGQVFIPSTAFYIKPTFGFNSSKNNYKMKNVEIWDENQDRYVYTDKRRFHDHYRSLLGEIEFGVRDVKWADQFVVEGSYSKIDKELQTGAMQNKVYGMAQRNSESWNLSARYAKRWNDFYARFNVSQTWDRSKTIDTAYRKYSWDGSWMAGKGNEINNKAKSIRVYERPLTTVSAGLDYNINSKHTLALNYMLNRRGNRRSDLVDKEFETTNDVVIKQIVSLSYSQNFFGDRLQNSFFVKDYINTTSIKQTDNSIITGSDIVETDATKSYWGAGLCTKYTVAEPLSFKGSYEHSVRLPLSRELLGNGTTVYPNLTLSPESSNNWNVGLFGTWNIDESNWINYEANGFIRHVQNYIRARVSEKEGMMQYMNEPAIDIKGFDFEVGYTWRNALNITVNGSWSDARDLKKFKTDGNPSATYNNKVPNRPWAFGNAEVSYTFRNFSSMEDRLKVGFSHRWVHWYYLNWEAYGAVESKAKIPTQNVSDVELTYSWFNGLYNISFSCNNLFDKLVYDNYMLQKPGRAFNVKFRIIFYNNK